MSIKNIKKKLKDVYSNINIDIIREYIDKYMMQLIYTSVIILLLIFIFILRTNLLEKRTEDLKNDYYQALRYINTNKVDLALPILENVYNAKSYNKNIKVIAGVRLAEILLSLDKEEDALNIYREIYSLKDINEFLKNMSGLAILNILINQNNSKNYGEIEQMIQKLSNPSNPLLVLVQEQSALFEIQRGNKEKGLEILNNILLQKDIDEETAKRIKSVINVY